MLFLQLPKMIIILLLSVGQDQSEKFGVHDSNPLTKTMKGVLKQNIGLKAIGRFNI